MNLNLRYPNITGLSEKEQLSQIKSFLHQLVDQLNYAIPSAESSTTQTVQAQGTEISYYELRSLIMQNLDKIDAEFEKLSQKMVSDYVPKTGWGADKDIVTDAGGNVVAADHTGGATEAVLYTQQDLNEDQQAQARANIGITGTGEDGQDGQDGQDGISPTVTAGSITGGHRITITDVNGTISFDVMDGKDGEDGDPGDAAEAGYVFTGRYIWGEDGYSVELDDNYDWDVMIEAVYANKLVNCILWNDDGLYPIVFHLSRSYDDDGYVVFSAVEEGRAYWVLTLYWGNVIGLETGYLATMDDVENAGGGGEVTKESIEAALGYTPADNDILNDFNNDIGELYTRTNALEPIVSTTDITAGSAASSGRPYHVIE